MIAITGAGASLSLGFLFIALRMRKGFGKIKLNITYVSAILHMYSIATGEAGPRDLVDAIAGTEQYGLLSRVFRRVRILAEKFGYGYTDAVAIVAQETKPPLKDFLMRCTEVFTSRKPRDYLEIETTTVLEEYTGTLNRVFDNLRLLGGIFLTFQSAIIFVIMTLAILTILMAETNVVYMVYGISVLSLITLCAVFIDISPREPFFYKGQRPPRSYNMFRLVLSFLPLFAIPSLAIYLVAGPPLAFAILGIGMILPGLYAYQLENYVNKIEAYYPTFIKAVSEQLMSVTDLKSVFSYVLFMELGPLKNIVSRALNRLKLGIGTEEVIDLMSSEAGSYIVFISNKIFLDAFRRGGDLVEVGKKLSNFIVKILELRKKQLSVARSFEMMLLIMQPLLVILLVVLTSILNLFSISLINLPFFAFGEVPKEFIEVGNVVLVLLLTFLNALSMGSVKGGYWGSMLLYAGFLLLLSAATWFLAEKFIVGYITEAFSIIQEIPMAP